MNDTNDLMLIVRVNEDIKSVVKLAQSINLLALNAILLSRKAGNVALGFGVISDELRMFSKTLTKNMETLMQLSYSSIQTISLHSRHRRMNSLIACAAEQIAEPAYKHCLNSSLAQSTQLSSNTLKAYEGLQNLLRDAEDTSRFGSVISRSLKIEATYGGDFSHMLTQIAADFGQFIDSIPEIIDRLNNTMRRKKMKKAQTIYQQGNHTWRIIARDPDRPNYLIDTNEYLIGFNGKSILTDPGGMEIFPSVFAALCAVCNPEDMVALFASHQDPDIISSLSLWLEFNPDLPCYIPWLWTGFIPHFGGKKDTFIPIPDSGMSIDLNGLELKTVPAHYLHSSGNSNLYDPTAKILFSGDIGAALLPPEETNVFVTDFDKTVKAAEGFHRRWMGSNSAKLSWCERVSKLDIDMLCPQHGAIFQGADVERFINWFAELEVGVLQA